MGVLHALQWGLKNLDSNDALDADHATIGEHIYATEPFKELPK